MITRIEIDGFKSFTDFSLDLEPLTVIAGPNGVGKSNLFDALTHLARLSDVTLVEAFGSTRGNYAELFALRPDGSRAPAMRFAVELLLPEAIEDEFSMSARINQRRLRYELAIRMDDSTHREFVIEHERLTIVRKKDDNYLRIRKDLAAMLPKLRRARQTPFIETTAASIRLAQDGNQGRKREYPLQGAQRTVLSNQNTVEFPHAFAARAMLGNLSFLQLNPERLRKTSSFGSPTVMNYDGEHIAAAMARIKRESPQVLEYVSNDTASIIDSLESVDVVEDAKREVYEVWARHIDGYNIQAHQLSDGTLRVLALVVISYDPQFSGVVMFEEPENGVHPARIDDIVGILERIGQWQLDRQVLVNTHSPVLVRSVRDSCLVMAYLLLHADEGPRAVTQMQYVYRHAPGDLFVHVARDQLHRMLTAAGEVQTVRQEP